jgi:thioester reductase-like protein
MKLFLTGITGFLGSNLLKKIYKSKSIDQIIVLIRAASLAEAQSKLRKALESYEKQAFVNCFSRRLQVMLGDVSLPYFGISRDKFEEIAHQITHIVHTAADVRFHATLSEARAVNLNGALNILRLAKLAKPNNLQQLLHISTAFVCGKRQGIIYEHELDNSHGFANSYEQSKYEAEKLFEQYKAELPIIILRPSIIVGDSDAGFTTSYNTLYYPLSMIFKGKLSYLAGYQNTLLDIVPVNFVVNAISYILLFRNNLPSNTFHLCAGSENIITAGEVIALALQYFKNFCNRDFSSFRFLAPNRCTQNISHQDTINQIMALYQPYISLNRLFDTANTERVLEGTNIFVPPYRDYFEKILKYGIKTNWGKLQQDAA